MDQLSLDSIGNAIEQLTWISILDIILVTAVIYGGFLLIRGTRAVQVLRGYVVIAIIILFLSSIPSFAAFRWMVNIIFPIMLLSIPVIFQPELRRALEQVGRSSQYLNVFRRNEKNPVVHDIKDASIRLSQRRHGALIVFERDTGLQEYIDTGIKLNSDISPELLLTIFNKNTELHDGAIIIRDNKIAAAACVMPLSTSSLSDRQMGLRHRAALGISEVSDAVSVVVSEETGQISITQDGRILRRQDPARLDEQLQIYLNSKPNYLGENL